MQGTPTPTYTCWSACGSEEPRGLDSPLLEAAERCALCRSHLPAPWPVVQVVSENSTIWDDLAQEAGQTPALCTPCAWAFRLERARKVGFLIEGEASCEPDFSALALSLLIPLGPQRAISLPITGRKHTLAFSSWGHVSSDVGALAWAEREAFLANAVFRLRKAGARWADLAEARVGMTSAVSDWPSCFADWDELKAWQGTPQLSLVCAALRKGGIGPSEGVER